MRHSWAAANLAAFACLALSGPARADIDGLPDYAELALGQNGLAILAPSRCPAMTFVTDGFGARTQALYDRLAADGYDREEVAAFLLTAPGLELAQRGLVAILSRHGVDGPEAPGFCDAVRAEAENSADFAEMVRTQ